jgi:lysozyme
MRASYRLIEKIKEFEGCRLVAYKDMGGVLTIGVGHTFGVKQGQRITQAQADSLLRGDLLIVEKYINELNVCKTQNQFDALVDFAFNLGIGNLKRSTLLCRIKADAATSSIQKEFMRWNRVNGKVVNGLTKRRKFEADLWAE